MLVQDESVYPTEATKPGVYIEHFKTSAYAALNEYVIYNLETVPKITTRI
jgi:hypothetical protein